LVDLADLVLVRNPEPFSTLAALAKSTLAGGVFVMNVYERSWYTVITTGVSMPSPFAVRALKFLQKSMMFTPCCRAPAHGGAGVAFPAGCAA
jgi:hypothetical protein